MNWFKELLLVLSPIIVAYTNYRSNKKTRKDIQLELEKNLKEKDAETAQLLQRIWAELESQKQLAVWNNSLPQTNEYAELAGIERYGNICAIAGLVSAIRSSIENGTFTQEDIAEVQKLLKKVKIPSEADELYPYEIPHIVAYKKLQREIDAMLQEHYMALSGEAE